MPTVIQYIQALGYAMNDYDSYAAAAGGANTVTIAELITAASNASTARFDSQWVCNETKVIQAKARTNGYTPSTGVVTIDPGWVAPVAGNRISFTRMFPMIESVLADGPSYRKIIGRALQNVIMPDQITVQIVAGQTTYSLAAYAYWLDRQERFGWPDEVLPDGSRVSFPRMQEPGPTGGLPIPADWRRPRLRFVAGTPTLEIEAPFATGTTGVIRLNVMRPGDSLLNGGETSGIGAFTDVALPSVNDIVELGKLEAYAILTARGAVSASGKWSDKLAAQREICKSIKYVDVTQWRPMAPVAAGAAA